MLRLDWCLSLLCCFGVLVLCAGCGGSGTAQVTGKVTLDGSPLEGATVAFAPVGEGQAASGKTDASGTYNLTTFVNNDGALPGSYKVTISKVEDAAGGAGSGSEDDIYAAMEKSGKNVMAEGSDRSEEVVKELVPAKYTVAETSGLTAEVTSDQRTFDFALESE